jgi:hypothetical protein
MESRRRWARRWIVAGFIVTAAGILTNWISTLTLSTFGDFGLGNTIDDVVYPLIALSTLIAWWFLSSLFAHGTQHHRLAYRAFLWLAVEALLSSVLYFATFLEFQTIEVNNARIAIATIAPSVEVIGSLAETVGFVLMMVSYAKNPRMNSSLVAFDGAIREVGDDVALEDLGTPSARDE